MKMSMVESTVSLAVLVALILGYILGRIFEKAKWIEKFVLMDDFREFVKLKQRTKKKKKEKPIAD